MSAAQTPCFCTLPMAVQTASQTAHMSYHWHCH